MTESHSVSDTEVQGFVAMVLSGRADGRFPEGRSVKTESLAPRDEGKLARLNER